MTMMKAVEAQKDLLRLLDAVEQGEEVVVELGGRRFRLSLVPPATTKAVSSPLIIEDAEVLSGNWTWVSDEEGRLQFRARLAPRLTRLTEQPSQMAVSTLGDPDSSRNGKPEGGRKREPRLPARE